MKKILLAIFSCALLAYYYFCWRLPDSDVIVTQPLPTTQQECLLPLDSRPVCTQLPKELAHLAGVEIILPPTELMDNYREPAKKEELAQWFTEQAKLKFNNYYASTDMLISGGLIASRQKFTLLSEHKKQYELLDKLQAQAPNSSFSYFSLVPRLLVSDELIPDRWYKFHLQRYSQLYHIATVFNDYPSTLELMDYEAKIPPEILTKYKRLFFHNYVFNRRLLEKANSKTCIVIGQDDGAPWGFPTMTFEHLEKYIDGHKVDNALMTYGADEIASMLIARSYLQSQKLHPKVAIRYAHPSIAALHMPYQSTSVETVLQEKLSFLGAKQANEVEADLILYVNCGHDDYQPGTEQAEELNRLIQRDKPVALIDLSTNFELKELLMPIALKNNVPIIQLTAYAGWNTFSNSVGTALPQALIFINRQKQVNANELIALHKERVDLICERLLDDYIYQKQFHARLKGNLMGLGIEPTNLQPKEKRYAEALINSYLTYRASELLHSNLGQMPFYEDAKGKYYLRKLSVKPKLPWNRVFEIQLQLSTEIGVNKVKAQWYVFWL